MLSIGRDQNLSTMRMPETRKFGNLGEIYYATVTNYTWIILVLIGCLIFLFIQSISLRLYQRFIDSATNERTKNKAIEFAHTSSSLAHSIIVCIAAIPLFCQYGFDPDAAINEEENIFIIAYKVCSVFSTSYFLVATYFDLMVLNHSHLIRAGMVFHHFLCIINQSQIFVLTSGGSLVSALGIQVEFSTIFLCGKDLAKLAKSKRMYCVSGILLMIFYPLTRIGILPYVIYIVYESKYLFEEWTGLGAYYLLLSSFTFVVLMSIYFYGVILKNPTKNFRLREVQTRSASKSPIHRHNSHHLTNFYESKIEIESSQDMRV